MNKLKCVFMGTPEIAVPALQALLENKNIELIEVISQPDRPSGRGQKLKSPKVIDFCKSNNIPYHQTEKINAEEEKIVQWQKKEIDIIIVFAFAQFLNSNILDTPQIGCFNIHTSLLPKYRGAAPIQYALLNGDKITGVSIQKMVQKMDAGDIVHSKEVNIKENETGGGLYHQLMLIAPNVLNEFIEKILSNNLTYTEQAEENVSMAPVIKKDNGHLRFNSMTVSQIKNTIAAYDPWPGTYCYLNNKRLKVLAVESSKRQLAPTEVYLKNGLEVGCSDGAVRLKRIQLEGKKPCTDLELLNGIREDIKIT